MKKGATVKKRVVNVVLSIFTGSLTRSRPYSGTKGVVTRRA